VEFLIWTTIRFLDKRLAHHWPQPMIAQSSGDPMYELQLAHSHQYYPLFWATTQGMSFRATTQGMLHQVHLKGITQSLVDHAHPKKTSHCPYIISWCCLSNARQKPVANRLAEASRRQAPSTSEVPAIVGLTGRDHPYR